MAFTHLHAAKFDRDRAVLEEHIIPSGLTGKYQTHASTITEAADGTLLAAWFGGRGENHPDVKIWVSRKEGDKAWSEPKVVDDGNRGKKEYSCWNPVLITHPDGTVYLYYKISGTNSISKGYRNWWGAVKTSKDTGKTWSDRIWLPTVPVEDNEYLAPYDGHLTGPVKNRPLIMPDGSLLCASSTETDKFGWRVHFELYQAGDWTGQKKPVRISGPLLKGKEGIQPSFLVHDKDYKVLQVLTREDGTSWSRDGGVTWSELEKGPIDTSKGLHSVSLKNGWHFLAFNPSGRSPVSLARTRDGKNWETILPVLSRYKFKKVDYPTIMQSRDGKLHVVHSYSRDNIKHLVLDTGYLCGDGGDPLAARQAIRHTRNVQLPTFNAQRSSGKCSVEGWTLKV